MKISLTKINKRLMDNNFTNRSPNVDNNQSRPAISQANGFDSLLPSEMACKAEESGVKKTKLGFIKLFTLAILAGAFIALGAIFATIALTGITGTQVPWGWSRVVAGLVFSLGLVLVVVGGAELFTGNNLIVMAWANRRITLKQVLFNWVWVYIGNFCGSIGTALLVFLGQIYLSNGGLVGLTALNISLNKVNLGFVQAINLGILCNALVCLAVWLTYSARSTLDKIASIILPISAFVAAGFEHCVANMYFIPFAIMVKSGAPLNFWQAIGKNPNDYADLTWLSFLSHNLLPVTIGNIIGGVVLVGIMYWLIYLKR
jgi:formate transporter